MGNSPATVCGKLKKPGTKKTPKERQADIMERIGVMSDTMGNKDLTEKATEFMLETLQVNRIFHLGNMYGDANGIGSKAVPLVRVPGPGDKEFDQPKIPNCAEEEIMGLKVVLCHTWDDIPRMLLCKTDIALVGGTHAYRIQEGQAFLAVMNPGHLAKPVEGGRKATLGMLLIDKADVMMEIYELNGTVRYSRWIQRRDQEIVKPEGRRK